MGGLGSGRFGQRAKKDLAKDSIVLNLADLLRHGLNPELPCSGTILSLNPVTRATIGSYEFTLTIEAGEPIFRLRYFVGSEGMQENVDLSMPLVTSRPNFGGVRWWFLCPLTVDGKPCRRRVSKLYLPYARSLFGCRNCHRLTYQSVQTHDKRLKIIKEDPLAMWEFMRGAFLRRGTWRRRQVLRAYGLIK